MPLLLLFIFIKIDININNHKMNKTVQVIDILSQKYVREGP